MATGIVKPLVYRSKYQSKWINTLQNPVHTFGQYLANLTEAWLNKIRKCWRRLMCNEWGGSACTCSGGSPFCSLLPGTCTTNISVLHGRFEIRLLDWRLRSSEMRRSIFGQKFDDSNKLSLSLLRREILILWRWRPHASAEIESGDSTLLHNVFIFPLCIISDPNQDRRYECNVTVRRVRPIIFAVEKQEVLYILSLSLASKAHALHCHLCLVRQYNISPRYSEKAPFLQKIK
jgi:hypothetical protein